MNIRTIAVIALATLINSAALAQQPLQASPITPGFWTWPREKLAGAEAVSSACQDKIAIQFADGRYFGLKLRDGNKKALAPPIMDEVGFCKFDPATQVERCELRINQDDGKVVSGVIESAFRIESGQIRMTVTEKLLDGQPVNSPSFDVYPTSCPEAVAWTALNGGQPPK